jgi:hypothetical protein
VGLSLYELRARARFSKCLTRALECSAPDFTGICRIASTVVIAPKYKTAENAPAHLTTSSV